MQRRHFGKKGSWLLWRTLSARGYTANALGTEMPGVLGLSGRIVAKQSRRMMGEALAALVTVAPRVRVVPAPVILQTAKQEDAENEMLSLMQHN